MDESDETKNRFMARLDKFLTRPDDRALFGLTVTPAPVKTGGEHAPAKTA
jgi:hypothetical protein